MKATNVIEAGDIDPYLPVASSGVLRSGCYDICDGASQRIGRATINRLGCGSGLFRAQSAAYFPAAPSGMNAAPSRASVATRCQAAKDGDASHAGASGGR